MHPPVVLLGVSLLGIAVACTSPGAQTHRDLGYPPPPYGTFFTLHPPGASQPLTAAAAGPDTASPYAKEQEMVEVQAGFFRMGADEGFADERPERQVFVERFFIDKYEVTNRQFRAAGMRPTQTFGPRYEAPSLPVVGVTWSQARDYCRKVGKRLPTETEWEKAARGADGRFFPWGNFWDPALANDGRSPRPVGSFPDGVSPYGAFDMAGNVWEWVADRYPPQIRDTHSQVWRVLRGGAWNYAAVYLRTTYRRHERADYVEHRIGFRCARDASYTAYPTSVLTPVP